MGRPVLACREMQRMIIAENIVNWHAERVHAKNWVEYAEQHPERAAILAEAGKLYAG